jgi:hypothetical protein
MLWKKKCSEILMRSNAIWFQCSSYIWMIMMMVSRENWTQKTELKLFVLRIEEVKLHLNSYDHHNQSLKLSKVLCWKKREKIPRNFKLNDKLWYFICQHHLHLLLIIQQNIIVTKSKFLYIYIFKTVFLSLANPKKIKYQC